MTPDLDPAQERNFGAALAASDATSEASGADLWALRDRVAFVMWTEGRGYNWGNDGTNTSNSPGFDTHPHWPEILRRSIDRDWLTANGLPPPDRIGSNGRSTGCTQALSEDVDGSWLTMAETLRVPTMIAEFCRRLVITDNPHYIGTLQKPGGGSEHVVRELSSPIAADVLRIQQPLMNEALSSNYDATQVAIAQAIARDGRFTPKERQWSDMATQQEVEAAAGRAFVNALKDPPKEFVDKVAGAVPVPKVALRRVHFYDQQNVAGNHGVANLDAGVWYFVPSAEIDLHWGVQRSLFGDGAKDWNEIAFSGGRTNVERPDVFGIQVHPYPGV